MPRIRTVKPEYPKHRKTRSVSRDARLLNIHLWNLADDEGRLQELVQWIIGEVFPEDEDVTPVLLREWLGELQGAGLIERYEVDGERYIECHDFNEHQVINKPRPSMIPAPHAESDTSSSTPVGLPDASRPEREVEREQGNGMEGDAAAARPYDSVLSTLDRVAFSRGIHSPKTEAAVNACRVFEGIVDLDAEVEKFAHYWIDGPGEKRSLTDVAWSWRQWLDRVRTQPKKPSHSVDDDLRALEAEAQRQRAEEAADAAV